MNHAILTENEIQAADMLFALGHDVVVREEDPSAKANIDLLLDGMLCELKNITNVDSSISNQIKRARIKWYKLELTCPLCVVFSTFDCADNLDSVLVGIDKRLRDGELTTVLDQKGAEFKI